MSDQKVMWFMWFTKQPEFVFNFALFNASRELQAYLFDGTDSTTVGNATVVTTLTGDAPNRSGVTGVTLDRVVIVGSDQFNNFRLGMYNFDDPGWSLVGNEFQVNSSAALAFPRVAAMGSTRVAIGTVSDMTTWDFDGTDWAIVGNSIGAASNIKCMDSISSTRVIVIVSNAIRIYDFDGTDWTLFAFLTISTSLACIAVLDATTYAVFNWNTDELIAYDLSGTTIAQIGNALSIASQNFNTMCALSATQIILGSAADDELQAYDFDGTDWTSMGNALGTQGVPEGDDLAQVSYLQI